MSEKSQFFRGTLEGCILKIINDKEVYGYEIAENLKTFGINNVSEGTIYPLLLRLEKNNLVISTKKPSPLGPKRKYYNLSDSGRDALLSFYMIWKDLKTSIDKIFEDYGDEKSE